MFLSLGGSEVGMAVPFRVEHSVLKSHLDQLGISLLTSLLPKKLQLPSLRAAQVCGCTQSFTFYFILFFFPVTGPYYGPGTL